MVVFAAPQLREYAEMGNDLSSCMDRMRTDDAPVKTRHLGDSVATQTGGYRERNGARSTPPTS